MLFRSGKRRRAYLMDDMEVAMVRDDGMIGPGRLLHMTEGELGKHHSLWNTADLHNSQKESIEKYYQDKILPQKEPLF